MLLLLISVHPDNIRESFYLFGFEAEEKEDAVVLADARQ
jgi:hypothetical protein